MYEYEVVGMWKTSLVASLGDTLAEEPVDSKEAK